MNTIKKFNDELSIEKIKKGKLDGVSYQDVRRQNRGNSIHHSTSFFIAKNFLLTSAHNVTKLFLQNVNKITIYPSRIGDAFFLGETTIDVVYDKNIRIAPYYTFRKRKTRIPHDMALIFVPDSIIEMNTLLQEMPYLPIYSDISSLKSGEKLYCAGYPASNGYEGEYKMTLNVSSIERINKNYFTHKLKTHTGNSGSPIMIKRDGEFHVIGINSIKSNGTLLNRTKQNLINRWMTELLSK